jgi:hypothetical protein
MAITKNTYTGNGSNKLFSISFEYLNPEDVDVYVNGVLQTITTQYSFANATTIEFVTAPANGATVILNRTTDDTAFQATFFPGSSIKANDLNDNFDQVLFISQEATNIASQSISDSATALANSTTALATANSADDKADLALGSVSSLVDYIPVLDLAALGALTPVNGNFYELANSTGVEGSALVQSVSVGFVGASGLSVRLKYEVPPSKFTFLSYYANDSETRYVKTSTGGTAAAPAYAFTGDTNTGVFRPAADTVAVSTSGTERVRVDSSGRLLVGTSSARGNFFNGSFFTDVQIERAGDCSLSLVKNSATQDSPYLVLGKTRGTSIGANNAVLDNDDLGYIVFQGSDGTELVSGAAILAEVDGTPGTNDMPGRLVFSTTADGASSPTEALRITSDKYLRMAASTGGIQFNGDTAAANALDDYEEGTFTPTISQGWTSVTYTNQDGNYTKIGNIVTAYFNIVFSGTSAGNHVKLGGLPFSATAGRHGGSFTFYNAPMNETTGILAYATGTLIDIYNDNDAGGSTLSNGAASGSYFIGHVTYKV